MRWPPRAGPRLRWQALLFASGLLPSPALALSLTLRSESTPFPGITVRQYRTSSPTTNTWVARIDLCEAYVHVEASRDATSTRSTGSWASDQGVQLATNGDFYTTSPLRVYGDAVGGGVPWPLEQTGRDPDYSSAWYYDHYGWIAFGPDRVEFTHSGWIKEHAADYGADEGWAPATLLPDPPADTLALVSGFPELVIEGAQYRCESATASDCFPDRSDMRARHPRTAMGITEDRGTFLLAVVDGRTSDSAGMYGAELADLMAQLGAWEAFNLDGGGSSQFWLEGEGYLNDYDGNNSGGGLRSVANHWGVYAGVASGRPARPGHCVRADPCEILPPAGGVLDDQGPCFGLYGNPETWRSVAAGHDGHLYWTNAFESDAPDNWAWWRPFFAEAGSYLVEVWADPTWSVYDEVRYEVMAAGTRSVVVVDPSVGEGWTPLGVFEFAAGGEQFVAVYDDYDVSVAASQHIGVDAVRFSRQGGWCGDGSCDEGETCGACPEDCPVGKELPGNGLDDDCDDLIDEASDTGGPDADGSADTEPPRGGAPGVKTTMEDQACGCVSGASPRGWLLALPLLLAGRRRRWPG